MKNGRKLIRVVVLAMTAFVAGSAPAANETLAETIAEGHPLQGALPAPRLTLVGLPSEEALSDLVSDAAPGAKDPAAGTSAAAPAPYVARERRFGFAAGTVVLLEALPWTVNRYLNKSEFAYISMATVRQNLETGFTYDRDSFHTDQSSHPFHGSLFFNAARSNGYSFWESGAFAFFGSFAWEVGMEAEPPAFNDLVNTTLGGMEKGEVAHRLATLLRDNTARGGSRFWRELGAAVLDPAGAFTRLLNGELNKYYENPPNRVPSRFIVDLEGFYRTRTGSLVGDENNDQGGAEFRARYGDPFDGENHEPYEYFEAAFALTYPASAFISRAESRGVLTDRALGGGGKSKQRVALLLHFNYYDNSPVSYGATGFDLDHQLLLPLGHDLELRTEAGISAAPLAALQVDYVDLEMLVFGRSFDYGPTAGLHAAAKLRRHEVDLARISWNLLWQSTLDGASDGSRVHSLAAEARVPVFRDRYSVGAEWSWINRMTTYDILPSIEKSRTAVRIFGTLTFR